MAWSLATPPSIIPQSPEGSKTYAAYFLIGVGLLRAILFVNHHHLMAKIGAWLGVQRVIQPLQRLVAKVLALGQGDFQAVNAPVGHCPVHLSCCLAAAAI